MGRAMKIFYNPVRRSHQAQPDQPSTSPTEYKTQPRLNGPYLASAPWRRQNGTRVSASTSTSTSVPEQLHEHTSTRNRTPSLAENVAAEAEAEAEDSDVLKRYSEAPFDLDEDCDDAIEEYFLTPSQVAERAHLAAEQAYSALQRAYSAADSRLTDANSEVAELALLAAQMAEQRRVVSTMGRANEQRREASDMGLLAEQRSATAELALARRALAQAEQERNSPTATNLILSTTPRPHTAEQVDLISTSLRSLAGAPRLTHRQPPPGMDSPHLRVPDIDWSDPLSTARVRLSAIPINTTTTTTLPTDRARSRVPSMTNDEDVSLPPFLGATYSVETDGNTMEWDLEPEF
ncbi:hypothetical protein CROQUDRAFT_654277 [Cronartium quercuum f. sp. fusiforme G11]|uniref:Uncharacterized protein n=1 Tax=Cronartium quercuum f. sp. fusiforme G11 TaxID=708437 RepID=A0A9P6NSV3_9BASI|nr:hypothetical protein CROQUDRAFT_654277 [Cronartium quercuum f. sp. fusiforme G11]